MSYWERFVWMLMFWLLAFFATLMLFSIYNQLGNIADNLHQIHQVMRVTPF